MISGQETVHAERPILGRADVGARFGLRPRGRLSSGGPGGFSGPAVRSRFHPSRRRATCTSPRSGSRIWKWVRVGNTRRFFTHVWPSVTARRRCGRSTAVSSSCSFPASRPSRPRSSTAMLGRVRITRSRPDNRACSISTTRFLRPWIASTLCRRSRWRGASWRVPKRSSNARHFSAWKSPARIRALSPVRFRGPRGDRRLVVRPVLPLPLPSHRARVLLPACARPRHRRLARHSAGPGGSGVWRGAARPLGWRRRVARRSPGSGWRRPLPAARASPLLSRWTSVGRPLPPGGGSPVLGNAPEIAAGGPMSAWVP